MSRHARAFTSRGLELEAAAADVWHVFAEEPYGGIGCNGSTGLIDLLLVYEDASCQDQSAGALPAGNEVAVDQQQIDPGFSGASQLRAHS